MLPALQDNALDGAVFALTVLSPMHFERVAKYVTETGQPAIFGIAEVSKKWYDSLPADLREIVDRDVIAETAAVNPWVTYFNVKVREAWSAGGAELISLSPQQQSRLLAILASVGADVSKSKPALNAIYKNIGDAAK